jgi:hypothetical protein
MVRYGHGWHPQLGNPLHQRLNAAAPIEKGVLGMQVEMDE